MTALRTGLLLRVEGLREALYALGRSRCHSGEGMTKRKYRGHMEFPLKIHHSWMEYYGGVPLAIPNINKIARWWCDQQRKYGGIFSGYQSLLALYLSGTPNLMTGTSPPSCLHLDNSLFMSPDSHMKKNWSCAAWRGKFLFCFQLEAEQVWS